MHDEIKKRGGYGSMPKVQHPGDATFLMKVDKYFKITERDSTLQTEVFAGVINFVANSYLLVLVPQMLANAGVAKEASILGFAMATFVSSTTLGLLSNLPIPAGPGLGCATYFAYSLARTSGTSGQPQVETDFALTTCLAAGLVMLLLALLNVPMRLFAFIPSSVKEAMPVGLGLLLSLCGFQQIGLVASDPVTGLTTGDLGNSHVLLGMGGVFCMAFLELKKFRAAFLIPIVAVTFIAWFSGAAPWPTSIAAAPAFGTDFIDWSLIGHRTALPVVSIYLICLFDIAGIMFSVSRVAGLVRADNTIPGAYWVFVCNALGTVVSAWVGCTPCIVFGESFAGVLVGGKTGLTAIVMGCAFVLTLPFAPILSAVPLFASAPVLVILGVTLLGLLKHLDWEDFSTALPSFLTVALMPYLYSIDRAIIAGLAAHSVIVVLEVLYSPLVKGKEVWESLVAACCGAPGSTRVHRMSVYESLYQSKLDALHRSVRCSAESVAELKQLFDQYDSDGSGMLRSKDLARLAASLGSQLSHEELEAAVSVLDLNRQGTIAFSDFIRWWQQGTPARHSTPRNFSKQDRDALVSPIPSRTSLSRASSQVLLNGLPHSRSYSHQDLESF